MRFATFRLSDLEEEPRVGLIDGDRIRALAPGTQLVDLLALGPDGLAEAGRQATRSAHGDFNVRDVRLAPPAPQPPTIRDFSSFVDHYRNGVKAVGLTFDEEGYFRAPIGYLTSPTVGLGHGELVPFPSDSVSWDYELEVCAIIGRGGRNLSPEDAEQHIAGYCLFNDWSARDILTDEVTRHKLGPSLKGKDFAQSIGPWMVTPDELEPLRSGKGYDVELSATRNGTELSRGNWADISWSFAEMISFASRNSNLVPGDHIVSGTVGTGCLLELRANVDDPPAWLEAGDEVALSAPLLGTLTNAVESSGESTYPDKDRPAVSA
jgi:2-keto-4-pentenoate hydratase/2-oxohepta-3-ene-1,7-dioic acid hydratase in catechol pathway